MDEKVETKCYRDIVITTENDMNIKLAEQCSNNANKIMKYYMKNCFVSQKKLWNCGVASLVAVFMYCGSVLNKQIDNNDNKDNNEDNAGFNSLMNVITQDYIYKNYIKKNISISSGISMIQLVQMIQCIISEFNLPLKVSYVKTKNVNTLTSNFINDLKFLKQLMDSEHNDFESIKDFPIFGLIINYRRYLNGNNWGHYSPLINVTNALKNIFIADTSAHKIKPHWIKTMDMIHMMNTIVSSTNEPRGYIRIYYYKYKISNDLNILPIKHNEMNIYIRKATPMDILLLSKIQVASWKVTYKNILSDEFLNSNAMTVPKKYKLWCDVFDNFNRRYGETIFKCVFVICQYPSKVLGYVTVGEPSRHAEKRISQCMTQSDFYQYTICGELYTMYLAPNAPKRKGLGSILFNFAKEFIRNRFNFKLTIQAYSNPNSSNKSKSTEMWRLLMCLYVLGDNQIAMNFYSKHKSITFYDKKNGANFGGKRYRYCGLIFDL